MESKYIRKELKKYCNFSILSYHFPHTTLILDKYLKPENTVKNDKLGHFWIYFFVNIVK